MEKQSLQSPGKERIVLVIMGVIAIFCLGFGVIANASKQRESIKRAELETRLDRIALENGKLQKELNTARVRLDEEIQLNKTFNDSLANEQQSAQSLRAELEKINQARRDLEKQIQQLQSTNKDLQTKLQAKAVGVLSQEQVSINK